MRMNDSYYILTFMETDEFTEKMYIEISLSVHLLENIVNT